MRKFEHARGISSEQKNVPGASELKTLPFDSVVLLNSGVCDKKKLPPMFCPSSSNML